VRAPASGWRIGAWTAIAALNNSDSATISAENWSTDPNALLFQATAVGYNFPPPWCGIYVSGDLNCTGTITAGAATVEGRQVKLYAVASPENWFEDFGSGQLSGGSARISLDAAFASTVNAGENYHVFLTPNGECEGLYVAGRTAGGFEVRELHHGASNVEFDYRIVAKRRGYERVRMEDITDQTNKSRQRHAEMLARRTASKNAAARRPGALEPVPRVPPQAQPLPAAASPVRPQ